MSCVVMMPTTKSGKVQTIIGRICDKFVYFNGKNSPEADTW